MPSKRRHARLKRTWLRTLQAGVGSFLVATAVVGAPPADAALRSTPTLDERVQQAKETLGAAKATDVPTQLAWWGNRIGVVGVAPVVGWPNWPNWHNWHNWGNYGPGWGNY